MNNLTINGIDHSKFDLEWANHGGIIKVYSLVYKQPNTIHQYEDMSYFGVAKFIDDEPDGTVNVYMLNKRTAENKNTEFLAMATPSECPEAGIEYIEPPARWLPINTLTTDIPVPLIVCDKKSKERGVLTGENIFGGACISGWNDDNITPTHWMPLPQPPNDK